MGVVRVEQLHLFPCAASATQPTRDCILQSVRLQSQAGTLKSQTSCGEQYAASTPCSTSMSWSGALPQPRAWRLHAWARPMAHGTPSWSGALPQPGLRLVPSWSGALPQLRLCLLPLLPRQCCCTPHAAFPRKSRLPQPWVLCGLVVSLRQVLHVPLVAFVARHLRPLQPAATDLAPSPPRSSWCAMGETAEGQSVRRCLGSEAP